MTLLIIGIIVMIGIHLVPAFPDVREWLVGQFGQNGYRLLFSVVSTLGLVLLIWGFAKAPVIQVWVPPDWTRYLAMVLMLPVFVLLIAAYVPGQIKAKVKNPSWTRSAPGRSPISSPMATSPRSSCSARSSFILSSTVSR